MDKTLNSNVIANCDNVNYVLKRLLCMLHFTRVRNSFPLMDLDIYSGIKYFIDYTYIAHMLPLICTGVAKKRPQTNKHLMLSVSHKYWQLLRFACGILENRYLLFLIFIIFNFLSLCVCERILWIALLCGYLPGKYHDHLRMATKIRRCARACMWVHH